MLTFFTTPKPFEGHIGVIQRNAIASWTRLQPSPAILIFGGGESAAQAADEFGIRHIPDIECNDYGTPLVNRMFEAAERLATTSILCYINADIILMDDFMRMVKHMAQRKKRFLMVGQRWDIDVTEPLDFADNWQIALQDRLKTQGKLHPITGIDYFVFTRGLWGETIPPFAVGRTAWDNWLIYGVRARGAAVVDASRVITAVHQNHDYSHYPAGGEGIWKGEEARRNQALVKSTSHLFTLADATQMLVFDGARLKLRASNVRRHIETLPVFFPYLHRPVRFLLRGIGYCSNSAKRIRRKVV